MNKYEAPENHIYYNGADKAKVLFANELPKDYVLVDTTKYNISDTVEDGLTTEFWENIQQKGEREDYSYAFCNSSYKALKPLYPIKATNVMYMFMNCSALSDAGNILVHITSEKPNMMYVCANCSSMINAPIFNFINAPIVKTYTSMYASCYNVNNVKVYWGDGSADAVTQRNACQNMFFKCWNLKDIDFGNAETGSPTKLDLSYSEDLTIESVQSLLTSLKTIPAGSAGTYEIILATKTVKSLPEGILTGFNNKGWTIKQQTRERPTTESEEQ